ncbi:MAG: ACP S-malonyltransferase [Bacteroidales bacterium]|jgi:[acyl-carrier-protein] S-malonyltransferase|nr:ACP S-malonyltransferase [Bacteroidales bacterium]OQC02216.1 MAG: Malonyl CoA-acyl carrier protein transacylase [Bacteroidetes bacterium ADurb.Bin090]MBP8981701.1 ACP S-malonyltransferase [Bacteroidales bacterium]NLV39453.1 ACP S-malonyltransferase [Bacteroidales bacterium]HPB35443.1 ACP S-malonyltransferase [Bacteroidales bacterium]
MKAYVFPGQGAQFTGMGKDLYDSFKEAKAYFELANKTLGFDLVQIMFEGSDDELKQTKVTQPAIFLHSVVAAKCLPDFKPDMVAGHSLGEFSALTAAGALAFEDGLRLVYKRAMAMQAACEKNPSTMAAVLGATDELVEQVCASIESEIVVPANYNCPGQIVISGSFKGVELASEQLKAAGVKRVLPLKVGGAFHSPLMESAAAELQAAISQTKFSRPCCPVYQNVDAKPYTDPVAIQKNLIAQLTSPVRWTQSVVAMLKDGAEEFIELGPGTVLQGLIAKIRANQ